VSYSISLSIYHLLFYVKNRIAAARRRCHRRQQEDKHRLPYQPINDIVTHLIKISHPPKAYQIYDIDTDRAMSSKNNNKNYLRTKTSSSNITNIIRSEGIENSIIDKPSRPLFTTNEDDSIVNINELKEGNYKTM